MRTPSVPNSSDDSLVYLTERTEEQETAHHLISRARWYNEHTSHRAEQSRGSRNAFYEVQNSTETGGVVFGLLAAFWALLILAYSIPTGALKPHLQESVDLIASEGLYPASYVNENTSSDNFTVIIMLSEAAHGGDPFTESLRTPFYSDKDMMQALPEIVEGNANTDYPRYWHGYLILLKPLLIFFNVKEIRLIFQTTFIILLGAASIMLYRSMDRRGTALAIALCLSMGLIGCAEAAATLPIFSSFAIALGATIWVAARSDDRFDRIDEPSNGPYCSLPFGFLIIGTLTAYFDFLDNPIITLGVPLIVLVCRVFRRKTFSWMLKLCLSCTLLWILGYGGAWLAKWVLASLVLGENVFGSAVDAVAFRTGASDELGFLDRVINAIRINYEQIGAARWLLIAELLTIFVTLAIQSLRRKDATRKAVTLNGIVILLIVAAIPLVWYAATTNHSTIHARFITYRTLVVQLFALSAAVVIALEGLIRKHPAVQMNRSDRLAGPTTRINKAGKGYPTPNGPVRSGSSQPSAAHGATGQARRKQACITKNDEHDRRPERAPRR